MSRHARRGLLVLAVGVCASVCACTPAASSTIAREAAPFEASTPSAEDTASATSVPPTDPSPNPDPDPSSSPTPTPTETTTDPTSSPTPTETTPDSIPTSIPTTIIANPYPWHTDIPSTTFWVGEIFDASAADGSQVISTYDSHWFANYGGCDGVEKGGTCETEERTAANDYFPTAITPKQNPFYLDLPFDDVNDSAAFSRRGEVIPWANLGPYAKDIGDASVSLMKNRWVELRKGDRRCYGQIEDAGPGEYNDANYVFGMTDARPENSRYGGAGLDVSPALNGCLGFSELDGDTDHVDWRFVDHAAVPEGPWSRIVTTSGVE